MNLSPEQTLKWISDQKAWRIAQPVGQSGPLARVLAAQVLPVAYFDGFSIPSPDDPNLALNSPFGGYVVRDYASDLYGAPSELRIVPEQQFPAEFKMLRCFVIMGFGVKTDLATGRKLDLDRSYRNLIKPAVEGRGLVCVRADEIRHTGVIDVPMYQELLNAEFVVADLSTANANALYELGIRHAMRPYTTVVISEDKMVYPFDLNHVLITKYTHLGDDIGYDEVIRFRQQLDKTLAALLATPTTDSPVYTCLVQLKPPSFAQVVTQVSAAQRSEETHLEFAVGVDDVPPSRPRPSEIPGPEDTTLATLIQQGEAAIRASRFADAKNLFQRALNDCQKSGMGSSLVPDGYLVQRLALATYKSKIPNEVKALREALEVLKPLNPADSNDPETLGLCGAIYKRLFDQGEGTVHLDQSVRFYRRGYYLRNDYYNGINLAYLLNVRTDSDLDPTIDDKIADLIQARRLRREVLMLCAVELHEIRDREARLEKCTDKPTDAINMLNEQRFWCLAAQAEAYFGLELGAEYAAARTSVLRAAHAGWMMETYNGQIRKLEKLLNQHGDVIRPTDRVTVEGMALTAAGGPLANVQVTMNRQAQVIASTTTNVDGYYSIELPPGTVIDEVVFTPPAGTQAKELLTPGSRRYWLTTMLG